jgi:hypothetical protein
MTYTVATENEENLTKGATDDASLSGYIGNNVDHVI